MTDANEVCGCFASSFVGQWSSLRRFRQLVPNGECLRDQDQDAEGAASLADVAALCLSRVFSVDKIAQEIPLDCAWNLEKGGRASAQPKEAPYALPAIGAL